MPGLGWRRPNWPRSRDNPPEQGKRIVIRDSSSSTGYRARAAARFSEAAGALIDQRRAHFTVVVAAIAAGRAEILRLHRARLIHDTVLHALEQELDLEEMSARRHLGEPSGEQQV
jgi:hypothetical protein